jgi:hypothetical protein
MSKAYSLYVQNECECHFKQFKKLELLKLTKKPLGNATPWNRYSIPCSVSI